MLLPDTVVKAAKRWISLFRNSSFPHAWQIVVADPKYSDVTITQYSAALDWLKLFEFIVPSSDGYSLNKKFKNLALTLIYQLIFDKILLTSDINWLTDSDILVPDATEIPLDTSNIAAILEINEELAFKAVRRAKGHIDLERRSLIGCAGEIELVNFLENKFPNSTSQVSLLSDGFGYDLSFTYEEIEWHLEVKSTLRRSNIIVYLSRHEFEVGVGDINWRLVLVQLDNNLAMRTFSTLKFEKIFERAPSDVRKEGRWQSASFRIHDNDHTRGLNLHSSVIIA
jgi:hypothetical protein